MFRNIYKKIKTLAIVCTILGCLFSAAGAIVCWCMKLIWVGFIVLIGGCLLSWVGSFLLYGFGELIEQATKITKGIQKLQMLSVYENSKVSDDAEKELIEEIKNEVISDYENEQDEYIDEADKINRPERDECPSCFHKISPTDKECPYCGYQLK